MDKEEMEKKLELKRQIEFRKVFDWGNSFNRYQKIKRITAQQLLEDC